MNLTINVTIDQEGLRIKASNKHPNGTSDLYHYRTPEQLASERTTKHTVAKQVEHMVVDLFEDEHEKLKN